jgi:hypothetical protein
MLETDTLLVKCPNCGMAANLPKRIPRDVEVEFTPLHSPRGGAFLSARAMKKEDPHREQHPELLGPNFSRNGDARPDLMIGVTSCRRRTIMKTIFATACLLAIALASPVQAKGCIKGAIVGGVAGHTAGHGKLGAVAGCAIGHHEANKQNANNPNNSNAQAPSGQK